MIEKFKAQAIKDLSPTTQLVSLARALALALKTYPTNSDNGVWIEAKFAGELAANLERLSDEAETEYAANVR